MIAIELPSSWITTLQISQSDFSVLVTLEGLLNSVVNSKVTDLNLDNNCFTRIQSVVIARALKSSKMTGVSLAHNELKRLILP
jgi:hypothetical protein